MAVTRKSLVASDDSLFVGRIATTQALTLGTVEFETLPIRRLSLTHAGAAGVDYDEVWDYSDDPINIAPGGVIGILAGALFDAVGTWQANISLDVARG